MSTAIQHAKNAQVLIALETASNARQTPTYQAKPLLLASAKPNTTSMLLLSVRPAIILVDLVWLLSQPPAQIANKAPTFLKLKLVCADLTTVS